MLSSRAAAFSVEALLTGSRESSKEGDKPSDPEAAKETIQTDPSNRTDLFNTFSAVELNGAQSVGNPTVTLTSDLRVSSRCSQKDSFVCVPGIREDTESTNPEATNEQRNSNRGKQQNFPPKHNKDLSQQGPAIQSLKIHTQGLKQISTAQNHQSLSSVDQRPDNSTLMPCATFRNFCDKRRKLDSSDEKSDFNSPTRQYRFCSLWSQENGSRSDDESLSPSLEQKIGGGNRMEMTERKNHEDCESATIARLEKSQQNARIMTIGAYDETRCDNIELPYQNGMKNSVRLSLHRKRHLKESSQLKTRIWDGANGATLNGNDIELDSGRVNHLECLDLQGASPTEFPIQEQHTRSPSPGPSSRNTSGMDAIALIAVRRKKFTRFAQPNVAGMKDLHDPIQRLQLLEGEECAKKNSILGQHILRSESSLMTRELEEPIMDKRAQSSGNHDEMAITKSYSSTQSSGSPETCWSADMPKLSSVDNSTDTTKLDSVKLCAQNSFEPNYFASRQLFTLPKEPFNSKDSLQLTSYLFRGIEEDILSSRISKPQTNTERNESTEEHLQANKSIQEVQLFVKCGNAQQSQIANPEKEQVKHIIGSSSYPGSSSPFETSYGGHSGKFQPFLHNPEAIAYTPNQMLPRLPAALPRHTLMSTSDQGQEETSSSNDQTEVISPDYSAVQDCESLTETVDIGHGVTIELLQKDLWHKFHCHGTEMIITKIGRRMFPVVRIRIRGLVPDSMYLVYLDMQPVDNKRYRYVYPSSRWLVAGAGEGGDSALCNRGGGVYVHPDSPAPGQHWNSVHMLAFDKLKLTNNKLTSSSGQICLHSMQKYQPRIWIQELPKQDHTIFRTPKTACHNTEIALQEERSKSEQSSPPWENSHHSRVLSTESKEQHMFRGSEGDSGAYGEPTKVEEQDNRVGNLSEEVVQSLVDRPRAQSVEFPETKFITVTAYQNQQITKLKINSNPFAKGFRDAIKQKEEFDQHQDSTPAFYNNLYEGAPQPSFYPNYHIRPPMPLPIDQLMAAPPISSTFTNNHATAYHGWPMFLAHGLMNHGPTLPRFYHPAEGAKFYAKSAHELNRYPNDDTETRTQFHSRSTWPGSFQDNNNPFYFRRDPGNVFTPRQFHRISHQFPHTSRHPSGHPLNTRTSSIPNSTNFHSIDQIPKISSTSPNRSADHEEINTSRSSPGMPTFPLSPLFNHFAISNDDKTAKSDFQSKVNSDNSSPHPMESHPKYFEAPRGLSPKDQLRENYEISSRQNLTTSAEFSMDSSITSNKAEGVLSNAQESKSMKMEEVALDLTRKVYK